MKQLPVAQLVLADPAYPRLKDHVIAATGLAYYADKDLDLASRIAQRLGRLPVAGCADYLALLANGPAGEAELDELIADLTIGETFFFRHREMFDALRDRVLPEVLARNQESRQLRIWSAGCATGAEGYSLSILLRRDLGPRLAGWNVTIVGTDINRAFLASARTGLFEEWAFRSTPADLKTSCFTPEGKSWLIKPEYREGVSFQYHNLVQHPLPSLLNNLFAFDVILCRNVTIYFSADIVQRLVEHFHQCLVDGGWLAVGHSEPNIQLFRAFRTLNAPGAVLYQKSAAEQTPWLPAPVPSIAMGPVVEPPAPLTWVPPTLPWLENTAPEASSAPSDQAPAVDLGQARDELAQIRDLADRGEWAAAAAACARELSRDKLRPAVYFYHALVLEQLGQHADGESALRRCIYLERGFVLAHYYLGLLLQKQGLLAQAARSFKNVQTLLKALAADHVFAHGDGITAAELSKLTHMHLEVLERA